MENKKKEKTKIDIILPNYNSSQFIIRTIKSILNQTYKSWKLIIVDDFSNKETQDILKKFSKKNKIKVYWSNKNRGAGYSRNYAIKKSNSPYLAFIDSDDTWEKDKLKKQINFMKKNNYKFTYTDYTPFYEYSNERRYKNKILAPQNFNYEQFINNSSIGTSTMIILRKLVGVIKFPKVKTLEDFPFKCRILRKNVATKFNENSTFYRISKGSLTSNKLKNLYWLWIINRTYNNLSLFKNLKSLICISINSFKKYGFK